MTGKYDGLTWAELVEFQTSGAPGNDGLTDLPAEVKLLDLAAVMARDAGAFAIRAQQHLHQVRGLPWAGEKPPEELRTEMKRILAWMLGHLIGAAHHLDADLLTEFAAWSAEIDAILPERPASPTAE
jgi:hypothetical protein